MTDANANHGATITMRPGAASFGATRGYEGLGATGAGATLARFNAQAAGRGRLALWLGGGAASLALLVGVGAWGYKVVLREVLGPPVVTAEAGPMRTAPAEPGGEVAPNQGLAVNAIPASGAAAPPSDVLRLAPASGGLAPEDMEVAQTTAEAGEPVPAAAPALAVTGVVATAADGARPVAADGTAGPTLVAALVPEGRAMSPDEIREFAAGLSAGVDPLGATPAATPAVAGQADAAITPIPASVPGVSAAPRPPARPGGVVLASAPAPAAPTPAATPAVATDDVAAGTSLVQLGAFDSPEVAAAEWDRLQGAFGEFLGSRERLIQQAESGGKTFYRLRATGFADIADARRLCAALVAEDAGCIPVVAR